ncbi:CHY zinc finger protein [Lysinibacillus sp. NPDC097195]|uniref:CHY zinc finger protein n=1 Tax=Lysinibacillus sp. NPDC097195 TaxID=3364141 RepID=UPI00382D3718
MKIFGAIIDNETRCVHYHTEKDIIAIKFACCERYYPCYKCHEEHAKHAIKRWQPSQFQIKAILCGHCKEELTIHTYMQSPSCPKCHAVFNDRCKNHYPIYFELQTD